MQVEAWPSIVRAEPHPPYAHITATASGPVGPLVKAIKDAFQDAMAMRGRLSDEAYRVNGFSGKKFRLFLNNLVADVPDPRYLEIGLFRGASFCSALFKNKLRAVGIDNWSEYGGKRQEFTDNYEKFLSEYTDVEIVEQDFRKVDYERIGKFNILFYDGSHNEKDQYDGVLIPQAGMTYPHIMIVDDWNWDRVRKGTYDAIRDAKLSIDYTIEVRTSFDGGLPFVHGQNSEWHNGCIVAVISK